jgi:hypothetical protein
VRAAAELDVVLLFGGKRRLLGSEGSRRRSDLGHEFRFHRPDFQNEFGADAAYLSHVVAQLGVSLRDSTVSEVEQVVPKGPVDPLL